MDKQIITFSANEQHLHKTGGLDIFTTKTVSYIEAHFDLGQNWSGYDSIEAVWWNDFVRPVRVVLDTEGICVVPTEVLLRKGAVYVNLVGVISSGNVLTDRLTTHPITAFCNKFNAQLGEGTTTPLTPSEYEQFVASVKADADRAETAKEDARGYAEDAEASAQNALTSETNAGTSATNAHTSEVNAKASEDNAKISEDNASASAESAGNSATQAESAKDDAEDARDEIRSMRAEATTLPAGSSATASYSNGLLSLGIPKGDKGDRGEQGIQGETGATPNLTIGTVETLEPTEDATATITGTAENPVLNLGIPQGDPGDVSYADLKTLLPMDTASGAIVSIPDGQPIIPVDSLKVSLEPIQSGSGTPSPTNIRPISGHTEVDTHRTGKNLFENKPFSDWALIYAYNVLRTELPKGVRLCMSFKDKDRSVNISDINFGFVSNDYVSGTLTSAQYRRIIENGNITATTNIPANLDESIFLSDLFIYPRTEDAYNRLFARYDIQIELGSTATAYEPYNGATYTTALGQTVCGGTLDVVTGELVVDRAMVTLDGTESEWVKNTGITANNAYLSTSIFPNYKRQNGICSHFRTTNDAADTSGIFFGGNINILTPLTLGLDTIADFTSWLATQNGNGTPLRVVYYLTTPTTIQLTPQEVKLLLGNNTIWSDGEVAIVYSADVTKWIEKQLS